MQRTRWSGWISKALATSGNADAYRPLTICGQSAIELLSEKTQTLQDHIQELQADTRVAKLAL
eukprot:7676084-Karenia_brevis.AAC.1